MKVWWSYDSMEICKSVIKSENLLAGTKFGAQVDSIQVRFENEPCRSYRDVKTFYRPYNFYPIITKHNKYIKEFIKDKRAIWIPKVRHDFPLKFCITFKNHQVDYWNNVFVQNMSSMLIMDPKMTSFSLYLVKIL